MTLPSHMPRFLGTVAAAAAIACLRSTDVSGQEYCVVCSEPAAVYRCQIENVGPLQTQPLKLACISALARDGGHARCAVRGGTVLDCDGPLKRVDVLGKPPAPGTNVPSEPYVVATKPKAEPDAAAAPQTVEDALRRAAKTTGESASQTGAALGKGVSKTWNCLTTFFKSC